MANFFPVTLVALAFVLTALPISAQENVHAQGARMKSSKSRAEHKGPVFYEDDEIKVRIPRGWRIHPAPQKGQGSLLLEKNPYTLSLAYHTAQASGVIGGRFNEVFDIGWRGVEDFAACGDAFTQEPWPASRHLMFVNVIVDTGDPRVRENCGIPRPLGAWVEKDGQKEYVGDGRWFGGYFSWKRGMYFFADADDTHGCGSKAYTLTSQATSPDRLPHAIIGLPDKPPELRATIEEAIDIVNSIHYKRCSPF